MGPYRIAGPFVMLPQAVPAAPPITVFRYFPALLILFAASGCAALIYEVVWYQSLQLAIGSTTVSMGVLLGAWMGGLCLGAMLAPSLLNTRLSPLRMWAVIELGIAVLGIVVNALIPWIAGLYFAGAAHGFHGMLLRGAVAAICLLPPTILMGASLPVIATLVDSEADANREASPRLGFLYGANTIGAVAGCLVAGFFLLRLYDVTVASLAAAALNTVVACVALALAPRIPVDDTAPRTTARASYTRASANTAVYVSIALSGAVALGTEAVWTRLLGMLLLGTVYVFAIILAVFLAGIAFGSWAGSKLLDRIRPRTGLAGCQILLAPAIAWTAFSIASVLPWWHDDWLDTMNSWRMYGLDLERCLVAVLPAAILFGASFPFACAAIAKPGIRSDRVAAGIYAANTLGAIAGALAVTLFLVPAIGSEHTQQILVILAFASGLILLAPEWLQRPRRLASLAGAVVLATACAFAIPATPPDLIAYGRFMALNAGLSRILYSGEGRNSSVAISQWENGAIYINVNGHVEATTEPYDMKLQRMVGHLPALLHANPESVLGIGFGAGVSAGTFTRYPGIQHITVCEIEPLIPPASTRFFARENYSVMLNPKTRIEYDDARHFLLTTKERFDVIASDPLDVFIKGTAALYSKEYFEAVKQRLNPGGLFSLYVPLYETSEDTIRGELATFFEAFPHGTVWANTRDGLGYDMVFLGSMEPLTINLDEIETRLNRPDYAPVAESLREVGIVSPFELLSTYSGNRSDLAPWTAGAEINRDSNLRLSYVAGWGINAKLNDYLYRRMLSFRHRPEGLFTGSADKVARLMDMMQ